VLPRTQMAQLSQQTDTFCIFFGSGMTRGFPLYSSVFIGGGKWRPDASSPPAMATVVFSSVRTLMEVELIYDIFEEQRLQAAQMKFLRYLLGITKLD